MAAPNRTDDFVALRISQLSEEEAKLRTRLGWYQAFSAAAVIAGIIVPVFVGSALATSLSLSTDTSRAIAGLVLLAAILSALHRGLNCETYHVECRRALNTLRSLIEGYEATATLDEAHLPAAIDGLETRLRHFRDGAFDTPPKTLKRKPVRPPEPAPTAS